jgi:tetratricopeptide (TPR) repeat protein
MMVKVFGLLFVLIPILSSAQSGKKEFNQGFDYYEEGEYAKAIDSYTNAIHDDSDNATYYYHRGVCQSLLSFNEYAIVDLNKAISLDSTYAEAYFERAYSKYRLFENVAAIEDYNQSIKLNPEYAPAYLNRGTVKFDMEDTDGACYDWKKAYNLGIEFANELIKEYCASKT